MRGNPFGAVIVLLLTLLGGFNAAAVDFPRPGGHVNDFAGVMDASVRENLEGTLAALAAKTGAEVAVAAVPDMGGLDVNTYAAELFKAWGIGSKERNDGVLLLLALKERKTRIEVGYGLEPLITDAKSGMILDGYVLPYFRKGDFGTGLQQGALALAQLIAEDRGAQIEGGAPAAPVSRPRSRNQDALPFPTLVFIAFILLFTLGRARGGCCLFPAGCLLGSMFGGPRHRGPFDPFGGFGGGFGSGGFGGGFGGGGFGGFGGGFSGGGGASRGF